MTIATLVPSLIRTYVPIVVGAFIAWLVTLGVEIDDSIQAGLVTALTGILIAAYYTVIRLLEKRWPKLSVLLGSSQIPAQYSRDGVPVITTLPEPLAAPGDPG